PVGATRRPVRRRAHRSGATATPQSQAETTSSTMCRRPMPNARESRGMVMKSSAPNTNEEMNAPTGTVTKSGWSGCPGGPDSDTHGSYPRSAPATQQQLVLVVVVEPIEHAAVIVVPVARNRDEPHRKPAH